MIRFFEQGENEIAVSAEKQWMIQSKKEAEDPKIPASPEPAMPTPGTGEENQKKTAPQNTALQNGTVKNPKTKTVKTSDETTAGWILLLCISGVLVYRRTKKSKINEG